MQLFSSLFSLSSSYSLPALWLIFPCRLLSLPLILFFCLSIFLTCSLLFLFLHCRLTYIFLSPIPSIITIALSLFSLSLVTIFASFSHIQTFFHFSCSTTPCSIRNTSSCLLFFTKRTLQQFCDLMSLQINISPLK